MESIFADSVPTGDRVGIFSIKHACMLTAAAAGPAISIGVFYYFGDRWHLPTLRAVLMVGTVMCAASLFILFGFRDAYSLGDESESKRRGGAGTAVAGAQAGGGDGKPLEGTAGMGRPCMDGPCRALVYEGTDRAPVYEDAGAGAGAGDSDAAAGSVGLGVNGDVQHRRDESSPLLGGANDESYGGTGHEHSETGFWGGDRRRQIRWIIAFSDVLTSLAAGMTIKFFPLFFIDEEQGYSFSPIQLSVVYLLCPLFTAFLALLCRKLAETMRRPIILLCVVKLLGTGLLFVLALGDRARRRPVVMAGVFIARTGLMNCPNGIKRAVLMDAVEKKSRASASSERGGCYCPFCPKHTHSLSLQPPVIRSRARLPHGGTGDLPPVLLVRPVLIFAAEGPPRGCLMLGATADSLFGALFQTWSVAGHTPSALAF